MPGPILTDRNGKCLRGAGVRTVIQLATRIAKRNRNISRSRRSQVWSKRQGTLGIDGWQFGKECRIGGDDFEGQRLRRRQRGFIAGTGGDRSGPARDRFSAALIVRLLIG